MDHLLRAFKLLFLLLIATSAAAQQAPVPRQDPAVVRQVVEQFLHTQSTGLPGQVSITVNPLDRLNLAGCAAPEAFLPPGSRVWGRTTVGVRCTTPVNWSVYISANVHVMGEYLSTATALAQGKLIEPQDLVKTKGDLTLLPPGILTDASQAVGRTLGVSLAGGSPLRQDSLRMQQVVQQNQTVRLVTNGRGFRVSSEAKALNNASEGQVVQARAANGQVISGVAKAGGIVEISY